MLTLAHGGYTIRTQIDEQGNIWWVAQDVGEALSLTNVRVSLESFPADEKGVSTTYTLGGQQKMLTVNEPGLYRLIFQSRKPEAG